MNIPTAAQARKAVEDRNHLRVKDQAKEIHGLIYKAIALGESSITGEGELLPALKAQLEALGYYCDCGNQHNQSLWSVSWRNPSMRSLQPITA